MRFLKLGLVVFAFAALSFAADPFAGSWKLDPAKSKYKSGKPPKDQTITFTEQGSDVDVVAKGTTAEGQPITTHFTFPQAGGAGKIIESAVYDGVSVKKVNANERVTSFMKSGKTLYTATTKLSGGGKVMTISFKGTNPAGISAEGTTHYDKQ